MELALIIALVVIAVLFFVFKILSGEKERIKTFLRIYKAAKDKFSDSSDREILEIVVEEHIPPGKASRLRDSGITGKQYLDGVFEQKEIDIDDLIYHLITLEFPSKYKTFKIDLGEIRESNRSTKPSVREQLKSTIRNCRESSVG